MKTYDVAYPDLMPGNIVHFYGARFIITSVAWYKETDAKLKERSPYIGVAIGEWLDGEIISGYFGPNKNWNFQGNNNARASVEF